MFARLPFAHLPTAVYVSHLKEESHARKNLPSAAKAGFILPCYGTAEAVPLHVRWQVRTPGLKPGNIGSLIRRVETRRFLRLLASRG
jgi:hypothetical protein